MAAVGRMDELVKDYLLYRGLITTFKSIDLELKNEKDKGFRVDKILELMTHYVNTFDLACLREYWNYLDQRIFCRLEQVYSSSVRKLEVSLLKFYLINAIQSNKPERVTEFFERLAPELQHQVEWKDWFVLPFIRNPEDHANFAVYFTRQWQETFLISLHNFLSVIFQSMPVPLLLSYEEDQRKMARLQEDVENYTQQLADGTNAGITFEVPRQRTCDFDLQSPVAGTPSASVDLMDDFFVISQDTLTKDKQQTSAKSNQIRSFIKNIGLPSSPIMGKRAPAPMAASAPRKTLSSSNTQQKKDSATSRAKTKSLSSVSHPATSTTTAVSNQGSTTDKSLTVATQKSKACDEMEKKEESSASGGGGQSVGKPDETPGANTVQGTMKEVPSSFAQQPLPTSKPDTLPTELPEDHSPFLLLSQEEYGEHRSSSITHCRFSTNGNAVATADRDGVVKVWSLQPSPVTLATIMSKSILLSIEWASKTDRLILLGNKAGSVRLFDVKEKKTLKEATVDPAYPRVISLCCNPAGKGFVCCTAGKLRGPMGASGLATSEAASQQRLGKLALWDLKTMKMESQLPLSSGPVAVNYTSYNHNGQLLVTGAADGMIRLYDVTKCECLASWSAHTGDVYSVQFSHDETSCYSMGSDGKFNQWSLHKPGQKLVDLPVHAGACGPFVLTGAGGYRQVQTPKGELFALDSEGNNVLTCGQNGGIIYRLDTDEGLVKLLSLSGHRSAVTSVDWSSALDSQMCLTGSMDGKVRLSTLLVK